MWSPAVLTLLIAAAAVLLFVTEWLSVDVVAMLLVVALVVTGVISPQEGLAGFSNEATLTVAFMFVLSAALLKTGALQQVAGLMAGRFSEAAAQGDPTAPTGGSILFGVH